MNSVIILLKDLKFGRLSFMVWGQMMSSTEPKETINSLAHLAMIFSGVVEKSKDKLGSSAVIQRITWDNETATRFNKMCKMLMRTMMVLGTPQVYLRQNMKVDCTRL